MKFFVVFLVAAALFQDVFSDTDAEREKYFKGCMASSNVNAAQAEKLHTGDYSEDTPETENFVFCMMVGPGYITEAGVFQKDVALAKYIKSDKAAVVVAIDACNGTTGATPQKFAFNIAKCFSSLLPGRSAV